MLLNKDGRHFLLLEKVEKVRNGLNISELDTSKKYYNFNEFFSYGEEFTLEQNGLQFVESSSEADLIIYTSDFAKDFIEEENGTPYEEISEEFYNFISKYPNILDKEFINFEKVLPLLNFQTEDFNEEDMENLKMFIEKDHIEMAINCINNLNLDISKEDFLLKFSNFSKNEEFFNCRKLKMAYKSIFGLPYSTKDCTPYIFAKFEDYNKAKNEEVVNKALASTIKQVTNKVQPGITNTTPTAIPGINHGLSIDTTQGNFKLVVSLFQNGQIIGNPIMELGTYTTEEDLYESLTSLPII
jgi:hypothetical protein